MVNTGEGSSSSTSILQLSSSVNLKEKETEFVDQKINFRQFPLLSMFTIFTHKY